MKRALITGITGQDGSYLAEFLLEKGYEVHGIKRRSSLFNTQRLDHIYQDPHVENSRLKLHYGDLSDSSNLTRLIRDIEPDEIYNLGAQSHVAVSFESPEYTADVDAMGTLRLLEAIRFLGLEQKTRFYQASTSELYGLVQETPQKETTPFHPRSPYAVAKLYSYWICINYREAYGLYACNGILFNHESPRRGETFVTQSFIDQIGEFENLFSRQTFDAAITDVEQRGWLSLLTMTNELLGAAHAENLLGVGEHRRDYQRLERDFQASSPTILQFRHLRQMQLLVHGSSGLFESRRHELSRQLEAQNALFRIRSNASIINELSGAFAADAESFLSEEREQTTTSIAVTKAVIVVSGLGAVSIALLSAVFVSKYVTANITAISAAMMRLAEGDKTSRLPKKSIADDEIGDLQRSFRVFRANALQLDRSNRRLNRQNALFERVFMNISDGVAISGPDGRLSATNPNFAKVLRLEADGRTQGAAIAELFQASPISADATRKGLTEDFTGYSDARSTDGIVIEIRRSNLPDGGGVWLFSDATERRQVEDRLRQIQHIESLGKVAGEVAHDFGNILSSLSTNIHLLETAASGQRATELVDRAKDALEIGGALVQRLLAFARKQALSPEVVDLKDLAEGMVDLIIIGLKEGVHLDTRFCEQPIHVQVDPGQLESAILNICLNASQSIDGGGTISLVIETSGENQVTVKITDTGSGMDEKTLSRAFEPFFSARRDGTGTGLGLAMVYGFMKQSGGDVEIESTLGEGTEVRLVFPIANSQSDTLAEPAKGLHAVIVEDDAQAMRHGERCLSKGGFEVQTATNFACAMSCLDTDISPEVVVTDLHLDNGETGWKIAEFCASRHPSAQIIIVSGRLPDDLPKFVKASAKIHCLEKPLTQRNLRAVLQS